MDNETDMVITPEIVPADESDTSSLATAAVGGFALLGAASGVRYLARKLPWSVTISRKDKDEKTQVVPPPPVDAPVAAE